jgi:hypothetical protein
MSFIWLSQLSATLTKLQCTVWGSNWIFKRYFDELWSQDSTNSKVCLKLQFGSPYRQTDFSFAQCPHCIWHACDHPSDRKLVEGCLFSHPPPPSQNSWCMKLMTHLPPPSSTIISVRYDDVQWHCQLVRWHTVSKRWRKEHGACTEK